MTNNRSRSTTPRIPATLLGAMLAAIGSLAVLPSAQAASGNWLGTVDATWAGANWSAATPGVGDTATFNGAGNGNTTIDLGAGVTLGSVLFDTASAAAYTIGSGGAGAQTLTFGDTGSTVTMNSTVANNQVFNSNIVLGTAIVGSTTITNLTTAAGAKNITFNGTISGGTGGTAGIKTFTSSVLSGGSITYTNSITAGGSSGINFGTFQTSNSDTTHTGTVTLSGAVTSTLRTLTATGGSSMVVSGQNVTVSTLSSYGATTTYGKFTINSGSVAFNGGIQSATSSGNPAGADGMAFIVNGGSFSAASVTLGRAINTGSTTTFFTSPFNMATSGFQVNGGTATVTGAVRIAGSNSSATGQVTGSGSLTIGGELSLGEFTTRNNLFQVTGGTLTNNDTTNGGIVIGKGTATVAAAGQLLLTGGTTTTEKITFGLSGGLAGSQGNLTLNGAGASLYVGSGGIVKAATNAYTTTINLMSGTLGAKAGWSSSLPMALAGTGVIFKAADASNVAQNISLSGVLSGANGFSKTGAGSLTLSGANTYSGTATISDGTIVAANAGALGTGDVTVSGGTLGSSVSAVSGIGAFTMSVGGLDLNSTGVGSLALAANKNFSMSGGTWSVSFASTSSYDQVLGSGTGTFSASGGTLALGTVPDYTASYTLLSGFSSGSIGALTISGYDTVNYTASLSTSGILSFTATAIPEPSTWAAIAGVLGLGFAAWRRRRAS